MIKLKRYFTPIYLNPRNVTRLTNDFISNKTNVWNHIEIKNALMFLSNNKCAYCECSLGIESKYMEVEHFEDKDSTPSKVVMWENLLPSCKRCNGSKGTHDVNLEPIINPFNIEPKEHLEFKLYRFISKTSVGQATIEVVDLNNTEKIVFKRFQIGEAIQKSLEDAIIKLERYLENSTTRRKNALLNHVESILIECIPSAEYSATSSTVLHSDKNYHTIQKELKKLGFWHNLFENLHKESLKSSF